MDQGLKERLIGAAVLVALGVWLIPWVLDGKQEQMEVGSSGDALRLPAPDQPLPIRSQTLRLEETESAVEAEPLASESVPAEASAESAKPSAAAPSSDARAAPGADAAPAAAAPLLARAEPKPAALGPAAAAPPAKPAVDSAASRPPVPQSPSSVQKREQAQNGSGVSPA